MKKTYLTFFFFLLSVLVYPQISNKDNSSQSINDLLVYFSSDFTVSQWYNIPYHTLNAVHGCLVFLNGHRIELYKYNLMDPEQNSIVENAKKTGTIEYSGITIPAFVNGSFILLSYEDHPERKKVIDMFYNF
jgi:hypothetical protein